MKIYALAIATAMGVLCGCSNKDDLVGPSKSTRAHDSPASAIKKDESSKSKKFTMEYISSDKINDDFDIQSIVEVFAALKSSLTTIKSEFETNEEYKTRVNALTAKPYLKDILPEDILAFKVEINKMGGKLSYEYDADKEILKIVTGLHLLNTGSADYFDMVASLKTVDAVGQNAFGAKTDVKLNDLMVYGIRSKSIPFIKYSNYEIGTQLDKSTLLELKVAKADAQQVIGNIAVLLVFRPQAPFAVTSEGLGNAPTRDKPIGNTVTLNSIFGEVLNLIIYDKSSKVILANLNGLQKNKK
jgi:hypothetical protein